MPSPILSAILAMLDEHHIEYRHLTHEPTRTSAEAARVRGLSVEIGGKALLMKAKRDKEMFGGPMAPTSRETAYATQSDTEEDFYDVPLSSSMEKEPKKTAAETEKKEADLSELPENYMQARFMLSTVNDLMKKSDMVPKEAKKWYKEAQEKFEEKNYSKALSLAIKAERLLDDVGLLLKEADGNHP